MTTREFIPEGAPAGQDRQRIVLELESSGLVSWRLWEGSGPGALDLGGDSFGQRGRARFEQAAADLLASGWEELALTLATSTALATERDAKN